MIHFDNALKLMNVYIRNLNEFVARIINLIFQMKDNKKNN